MQDQEKRTYVSLWGDTADFRHSLMAMTIGAVLGLGAYLVGLRILQQALTETDASLVKAYALLCGLAGCLAAGALSARLFAPKRTVGEGEEQGQEGKRKLLEEMNLDPDEEARELENLPPEVVREMKELDLYDLFASRQGRLEKKEGSDGGGEERKWTHR
jgi:hypothetical protein